MVNFAELKAKAEKAKDAGITKMTNTRDRYSSVPASQANWDPNWKRAPPPSVTSSPRASTSGPPPPPSRSRPDVIVSGAGTAPPAAPRASRPTHSDDLPAPPSYTPLPPPTRAASGYPHGHRETSHDAVNRIDWVNLTPEDKEAFFGWLDEFFSRYLGIELSPRERRSAPPTVLVQNTRPPPTVNMATRPQV